VLISVDREGTGLGYDIDLIRSVTRCVSIPVVACGGAGNCSHVITAIKDGGADAAAIASILHYDYIQKNTIIGDYSKEGNIEFLKKGISFTKVKPTSIPYIKKQMIASGIPTRVLKAEGINEHS
jgi:cyclase